MRLLARYNCLRTTENALIPSQEREGRRDGGGGRQTDRQADREGQRAQMHSHHDEEESPTTAAGLTSVSGPVAAATPASVPTLRSLCLQEGRQLVTALDLVE